MKPRWNILIGTRGQYVKMAGVLHALDKNKIPCRIINTGQHTRSTREMARVFQLKPADIYITQRKKDLTSLLEAIGWFIQACVKGVLLPTAKTACSDRLLIVHGDTLSTLLGVFLARVWGQHLVHIESGLTSGLWYIPFPEELIRRAVIRCSRYLFCPSDWAKNNLVQTKVKGTIVNTRANTVLDALRFVTASAKTEPPSDSYGVVTLHRNETFFRKEQVVKALDCLEAVPGKYTLLFVVHKLTERQMKHFNLWNRLVNMPNIQISGYMNYDAFMSTIQRASFVITDGGGLQEETYYLNVPCLIFRDRTERREGLGDTAQMIQMNPETVKLFFDRLDQFKCRRNFEGIYPSAFIVDSLLEMTDQK